ncbi:hypothetical protein NPIL_487101 [Nephila pilipes]|uniref:Uncharacterized protein n=1 Tax=Nephila pilipes TaxID=299642 RepID=A0A8X6Q1U8_NEPPI|nr:hypothetical protein NPIL_487101 [Nephila pilipes]
MERYTVRSKVDLAPSPDDLYWTEWNDLHALGVRTMKVEASTFSRETATYNKEALLKSCQITNSDTYNRMLDSIRAIVKGK